MSFNTRTNRKTNWYIHTVELFSSKNEGAIKPQDTEEELCLLLSKEAHLNGYILYDSNYLTFQKRQNYSKSKKISSCQDFGERFLGH